MQKRAHRKIGRFLSLLMTVVLVCSMIPMNAYAKDETVSLFNEELDMELNNIEEDETESLLPAEDDLALLEEEVQAETDEEETDEEETLPSTELTDESTIPEETPLIPKEEVTETTKETIAEVFNSPQPETVMVIFDLNDGTYTEFYDATVPVGGKITDRPADPTRDGYLFKGWYSYLDDNDEPVMWNFKNDTVMDNMSLWAAWEEACIVAFDPDDGTQYGDFYKTTVPVGGKVTDKPADPTRDGYLFKGWYGYLDGNNEPVMWNFENDTVTENTTLWAAWEEACIVAFDPDDGTQYEDFYKTTVPVGGKVTHKPADPTRDGYLFKGWYSYLGENDEPVMWDFENDTVAANMTLWASWTEDSNGGNNNGGGGEGENNNNGGGGEGENNNNGGNNGGGTGGSGGSSGGSGSGGSGSGGGPVVSGNSGNNSSVNINEQEIPKSPADGEYVDFYEQEVPKEKLDNLPKTGEDSISQVLYGSLILLSLFMFGICLPYRKKTI